MRRVVVINPNSNQAVTDGMDAALAEFSADDVVIECVTLAEGPFGIESQADIDAVIQPLRDYVANRADAAAFVIACYSDPGLNECRAATDKPVLGIQESALRAAAAGGNNFGVIAILDASIPRHAKYMAQLGVLEALAGERAVNLSVAESATGEGTFDRLMEIGSQLQTIDHAEAIVLGCAGMAAHRAGLQSRFGIPVIDPVQTAVGEALALVQEQSPVPGTAAGGAIA